LNLQGGEGNCKKVKFEGFSILSGDPRKRFEQLCDRRAKSQRPQPCWRADLSAKGEHGQGEVEDCLKFNVQRLTNAVCQW